MYSLAQVHLAENKISLRDFLRAAYMSRYGKELPPQALREDEQKFARQELSDYVVRFLRGIYGTQ